MAHLTAISWNVYRNARPAKVERTLERLIQRHAPDVILIQEAPVYHSYRFAELDIFAEYDPSYAPVHKILQPTRRFPFLSTGQLTLSKATPDRVDVFPLPPVSGALRPASRSSSVHRLALYIRIKAPSGVGIGVYNLHLENRSIPSGRLAQVDYLLESIVAHHDDDVVIIGGDMNTFLPSFLERSIDRFASHGFTNLFAAERRLLPRLDYFLVRGADAWAVPVSGAGSDHQPILAKVALSGLQVVD